MSGIFHPQPGSSYWLPTQDEWYKAAFYDPTKNDGVGGYWKQATRSDTLAGNDVGVPGAGNYFDGRYAATDQPTRSSQSMNLTPVGAYGEESQSYYGLNDQMGNVAEWLQGDLPEHQAVAGGAWDALPSHLNRLITKLPTQAHDTLGFRIAGAVPEPSSAILIIFAAGFSMVRRTR